MPSGVRIPPGPHKSDRHPSSEAEHFHGKEGVASSILAGGSRINIILRKCLQEQENHLSSLIVISARKLIIISRNLKVRLLKSIILNPINFARLARVTPSTRPRFDNLRNGHGGVALIGQSGGLQNLRLQVRILPPLHYKLNPRWPRVF